MAQICPCVLDRGNSDEKGNEIDLTLGKHDLRSCYLENFDETDLGT